MSGKILLSIELLPQHMRGMLISQLHVLCRLRGEPVQLLHTAQLTAYLSTTCGGLLEQLYAEWYVDETGVDASSASRKRKLKSRYTPLHAPKAKRGSR